VGGILKNAVGVNHKLGGVIKDLDKVCQRWLLSSKWRSVQEISKTKRKEGKKSQIKGKAIIVTSTVQYFLQGNFLATTQKEETEPTA